MRNFRNYEVWKKSHVLTLAVYRATDSFPNDERFGLTSQLRRAAASIPANIAEGGGRETDGDFRRFIEIAAGSACEVEYHLQLAHDLKLLNLETYQDLDQKINEIKKMLGSFRKRLVTPKS